MRARTPTLYTKRSALLAVLPVMMFGSAAQATPFNAFNLVTDDQSKHKAVIADPDLVNAWGVSFGPKTPFWVSDNGAAVTTLYSVDPLTNAPTKVQQLTVSIPGAGTPTGQTFNAGAPGGSFNGDAFLFVSEDGTISGWRPSLGTAAEILQTASTANVYKGATEDIVGGHDYLLSANFRAGSIDVLKGDAAAPPLPGTFVDPGLPAGYAPFDIRNLGGKIFIT